jgi:cytochrome c biogenesis protein CcmG, thiol:disulfide interchange protein DsbE
MATRDAAAANRSAAARRSGQEARDRRSSRLPLIIAAVVALAAAVAIAVSVAGDGGNRTIEDEAANVRSQGAPLDPYADGTQDPAVGQPFPTLNGTGLDGTPFTISGNDGPAIIVYLAHWCHVCQSEVPVIRDWLAAGGGSDITVRAVSTGFQRGAENWPPSEWLERERWEVPTLMDPDGAASDASGLPAFPFFVVIDSDGNVVTRTTGAVPPDQLDAFAAAAADT